MHALIGPCNHWSWHTFEATFAGSFTYSSATHHCMIWKGPGKTVSNATVPTSPPGDHSLREFRHVVLWRFGPCLHWNSADVNFANKGKCMPFYCCFGHYRMLAYKILTCEVCIIQQKPTEALKKSIAITESRTGKPAMVTVKIQLDCSTVHDTTLWANI